MPLYKYGKYGNTAVLGFPDTRRANTRSDREIHARGYFESERDWSVQPIAQVLNELAGCPMLSQSDLAAAGCVGFPGPIRACPGKMLGTSFSSSISGVPATSK